MIDSEFDECFFESAEEQRKFKKRVSDAIAEMPVEPDQFAQDWRAQLDLENKLYEELVAECPREVKYFFFQWLKYQCSCFYADFWRQFFFLTFF